MKQSRRKELKTNELRIYLQELRETVARNSNYIIGGIVVVVLILMIGLYVQGNRAQTEASNWRKYREIQEASAENKTDVLTDAADLAAATAGDRKLGPRARELYAQLLYSRAMTISPLANSSERAELLDKSKAAFEELINKAGGQPDMVARARLGLAEVEETLYVSDKGSLDAIAAEYRKVIDSKEAPYAEKAKERLDTLVERTAKLQIVATRPAETPASAPAAASRPASAPAIKIVPAASAPAK
jgi:hypothetical protein